MRNNRRPLPVLLHLQRVVARARPLETGEDVVVAVVEEEAEAVDVAEHVELQPACLNPARKVTRKFMVLIMVIKAMVEITMIRATEATDMVTITNNMMSR